MKKITVIAAAAAFVGLGLASCNGGTPSASINNDLDSLSYALGMSQTQGLKGYLQNQMGVDTTYIDEFVKGLNEGANAGDDKKKAAYYAGIQIGQQISQQMVKGINYELFQGDSTKTISVKNFLAGFIAATKGDKTKFDMKDAGNIAQEMMKRIKTQTMMKEYGPYKKENEDFLAKNAKAEGIVTLPGGVQYKVVKAGNGPCPADTSKIKINYEGRTIDGKVFDSSYERKQPLDIRLNQMIEGWRDAIVKMPEGSTWEIYIPQEKGYAERQAGAIKPFSTLIFKIELLSVNK